MGANPHPTPAIAAQYVLRGGETTESRDDRILDGLRGGDARALEAAFFAYNDGLFAHVPICTSPSAKLLWTW